MQFISILLFVLISQPSFGISICSDLAAHTCAPGEPHDGTGTTKLIEPLTFVNAELDRIRPRLVADFSKMMKGSAELRGLAVKAYGFEEEKACKSSNQNRNCIGLIVDRLIESYKLTEFNGLVMNSASFFAGDSLATSKLMGDSRYRKVVNKIAAEQVKLVSKKLLERVEKVIFPQTKEVLLSRVRSLSIEEPKRAQLIAKIESVDFEGADCHGQKDAISIAPAFAPTAFYNPMRNSFYFCLGFFRTSDSEFSIAYTIAHELSHSIDPCQITDGESVAPLAQKKSDAEVDDTYLKKNFLKCLRSEDSVAAKHFSADNAPSPISAAEYLVYNDTERFCGGDNVNETVPDWFAAETIGDYAKIHLSKLSKEQKKAGFTNVLRATCGETIAPGAQHLSSKIRINGLLLVQPKIRAQMGCSSDAPRRYCDIDNPKSLNSQSLTGQPLKEKPLESRSEETSNEAVK